MTSSAELPRQAKPIQDRVLSLAFWGLAVIVLLNLHYASFWGTPGVRIAGLSAILGLCLLLSGLGTFPSLKESGTLTIVISATLVFYLVIGVIASFVIHSERQPDFGKDVLRQAFFFLVLLAVALGGRSLLERLGVEVLLKGVLTILTASCFVILASPVLRGLGVLSVFRLKYPLTGAFTQPHDAGFIGCMTAALTFAWLCNDRRHKVATRCCLTASVATVLGSFSWTACIVLTVLWFFYLLSGGTSVRHLILRWGIAAGAIGTFVYLTTEMKTIKSARESDIDKDSSLLCSTVPPKNSGLIHDCTILLMIRDTLAGGATLNWNDSRSIASWHGVKLGGTPARILSLDLRRMGLSGRIPTELSGLDRLNGLWLDHNQLAGPIPPELGRLANLRVLGLSFNALTGPIPPELGSLSNLEELLLRGNDLTGGIPVELERLNNLWYLHFREESIFNALVKIDNRDLVKRVLLWRTGMDRFLESPLVGAGIGRLRYDAMKGPSIFREGRAAGVHNVYLMLAGEAGIVPLSFYIFFLFSLLRLRWTAAQSLGRDVVVYWALVMGLYGTAFHHVLTLGAFVWFAGLCCAIAATLGMEPVDGLSLVTKRRAGDCLKYPHLSPDPRHDRRFGRTGES